MTKLPESSWSPGSLVTASASPVIRDSFTWTWPVSTGPSAGIWLPAVNSTTSSRTSWSTGRFWSLPSRTTRTLAAERRESFSMVRLLFSCWAMPMTALAATMRRKVMSFQSPTSSRHTASTTKIRLK